MKISIIGTGAWATALGHNLAKNNHEIVMYGIDNTEISDINNGQNTRYFVNKFRYKSIYATNNLSKTLNHSELIVLAIPSQQIANVLNLIKQTLGDKKIDIINVAKGLDGNTKQFYSSLIRENFAPNLSHLATIIGPSYAQEVFDEKLTIVNVVGNNYDFLKKIANIFNNNTFKLIPSTKETGLEMFSAMKNILAIGIGIMKKLFPEDINPISALFAIGFKEMFLIYKTLYPLESDAIGYELAAIGDSFLTCSSFKSRNTSFGYEIAKVGFTKALANNKKTVEGYVNAKFIGDIIKEYNIKAPYFVSVYNILYNQKDPKNFCDFI